MNWKPINQIANDVNSKKTSAVKNVETAIKNLEDNSEYNLVINFTKERAIKRAKEIDSLVASGKSAGKERRHSR